MRVENKLLVSAGDMSVNVTSPAIWMEHMALLAVQMLWTGTPTGNFTLEGSCDPGNGDQTGTGVTNWIMIANTTQAAGAGAGKYCYWLADVPVKWVRLVYSRTSGTGSVDVRFNAKGF